MKLISTLFLRIVIIVFSAGILALCIFALPSLYTGGSQEFPTASRSLVAIMIILYATLIPYAIAVRQTFKLLKAIDQKHAFSDGCVEALRNIKYCAIAITVLYVTAVPLLIPIADADDAPGLILMGMTIAAAPLVVAVLSAILERLLHDAITFKTENDLTV